jgi:hypothetical protein
VFNWASITLKDGETRTRLQHFLDALHVDLVIADPLSGLGMDGVGSPADTQAFVDLLRLVGLGDTVAWWILHHFRKDPTADEIEQFRGAWSGHGDALLALKSIDGDRARLSFPKLRWAKTREPLILRRDRDTASFTVVAEGENDRDYAAEILEHLAGGDWSTASELERSREKGGIGANRTTVRDMLQLLTEQGLLEYAEGPPGKAPNAKCWRLYAGSYKPVQAALSGAGLELVRPAYISRRDIGPVQATDPRLDDTRTSNPADQNGDTP